MGANTLIKVIASLFCLGAFWFKFISDGNDIYFLFSIVCILLFIICMCLLLFLNKKDAVDTSSKQKIR